MTELAIRSRSIRAGAARALMGLAAALVLCGTAVAAEEAAGHEEAGHEEGHGVDWQSWMAGNEVTNTASLQRGAANFVNYCLGCHSLKYMRYSRMGEDLEIAPSLLQETLLPPGAKSTDYIKSSFPAADAEAWFGKSPPDLSLVARARGADWVY